MQPEVAANSVACGQGEKSKKKKKPRNNGKKVLCCIQQRVLQGWKNVGVLSPSYPPCLNKKKDT
jgi:hypothetical protein